LLSITAILQNFFAVTLDAATPKEIVSLQARFGKQEVKAQKRHAVEERSTWPGTLGHRRLRVKYRWAQKMRFSTNIAANLGNDTIKANPVGAVRWPTGSHNYSTRSNRV